MAGFGRIVACCAGSGRDGGLLRYARAVAVAARARVEFLHVARAPALPPGEAAALGSRRLEELCRAVDRDVGGDLVGRCYVRFGETIDQILLHAAETRADVILVGHDPRRRGRRSAARRLAAAAPCSVWMAPEGAASGIGAVLAAVDLSPCSAEALEAAAAIAAAAGSSRLAAIHVYRREDASTDEALRRLVSSRPATALETVLLAEGGETVGQAILRRAASSRAGLIVVGARGANASTAVLLGAEAEQILRESPTPVLVVKPPAPRLPLLGALLGLVMAAPASPRP